MKMFNFSGVFRHLKDNGQKFTDFGLNLKNTVMFIIVCIYYIILLDSVPLLILMINKFFDDVDIGVKFCFWFFRSATHTF